MRYLKPVTQKPIINPDPDAVNPLNDMIEWVSTPVLSWYQLLAYSVAILIEVFYAGTLLQDETITKACLHILRNLHLSTRCQMIPALPVGTLKLSVFLNKQ
jgi:hypothetical protein